MIYFVLNASFTILQLNEFFCMQEKFLEVLKRAVQPTCNPYSKVSSLCNALFKLNTSLYHNYWDVHY